MARRELLHQDRAVHTSVIWPGVCVTRSASTDALGVKHEAVTGEWLLESSAQSIGSRVKQYILDGQRAIDSRVVKYPAITKPGLPKNNEDSPSR